LRNFRGIVLEFHVEFRKNCMYFQYLLCKIPGEIPMEFSSPTPDTGSDYLEAFGRPSEEKRLKYGKDSILLFCGTK
jgi:hypothetical protein